MELVLKLVVELVLMVIMLLEMVMMLMMVMLVLVLASPRPSFIWCHTHYPPLLSCTNLTDDDNPSLPTGSISLLRLLRDVTLPISFDWPGTVSSYLVIFCKTKLNPSCHRGLIKLDSRENRQTNRQFFPFFLRPNHEQ